MKTILQKGKLPFFILLFFNVHSFLFAQTLTVTISVTTQPCNTNNGEATATVTGGIPPYSVSWYGGSGMTTGNPATNLAAGTYSVYASDNFGHYGYTSINIGIIQMDSLQSVPDTCNHGVGSLTAFISGGTAPFTYAWSNITNVSSSNTNTNSNLNGNNSYPIVITDAAGCVLSFNTDSSGQNFYVSNFSPVQTTTSSTACNCNDGTATVIPSNGTAPYSYLWNTTPPQSTQTAIGLDALVYYNATVIDAAGCTASAWAYVNPGPAYIQSTATVNNTTCPYTTGSIALNVSGGTPPYSYLWNPGQTTANISGLAAGTYTCQITDAAGCTVTRHKTVYLLSPINIGFTSQLPTCTNADGILVANASGGTPPYTYHWSDNQTTQTAGGLAQGYYWVQVTDQNGCYQNYGDMLYEPDTCYSTFNLRTWHDINGNCIEDAGEYGLPNVEINSYPVGILYSNNNHFTNINGQMLETTNPGSIDIAQNVPASWTQICPASPFVTTNAAANNSYNIEFFDHPDSIFDDLAVYLCASPARPGSIQHYYIAYSNHGTEMLSGSVTFNFDPQLLFSSSNPMANSITGSTATFNFSNLLPLEYRSISINCFVPVTSQIGDTLHSNVAIVPVMTDVYPENNFDSSIVIVTGSYDPNYKTVTPGRDALGTISTLDSLLRYTIHFQNVGTGYAYEVRIVDTLDLNLDPNSLEMISAVPSFPQMHVNGRIITFDFVPVYLSDSLSNPEASQGFVSFQVKQNPSLAVGTEIMNRGYIYFDFNEPIATNQTLNTIAEATHVPEIYKSGSRLNVFPNPVKDVLNIAFSLEKTSYASLKIVNALGQEVWNKDLGFLSAGNHYVNENLKKIGLRSGIYFITLYDGQNSSHKKIIIE
jgi:hypothetical protein